MNRMQLHKCLMRFPDQIAHRHRFVTDKLGPAPADALQAMTDYGLSEREIASYYGLTVSSLARLRRALHVSGAVGVVRMPDSAPSRAEAGH